MYFDIKKSVKKQDNDTVDLLSESFLFQKHSSYSGVTTALIMCLRAMLPRRHFKLQLKISPEAGDNVTLKAQITFIAST